MSSRSGGIDAAGNPDARPPQLQLRNRHHPPRDHHRRGGRATPPPRPPSSCSRRPVRRVFSCRLDGAAWEPCGSPHTYSALGLGPHQFEVMAVDAAGKPGSDSRQPRLAGAAAGPRDSGRCGSRPPPSPRSSCRCEGRSPGSGFAPWRAGGRCSSGPTTPLPPAPSRSVPGHGSGRAARRRWIRVLAGERDVPGRRPPPNPREGHEEGAEARPRPENAPTGAATELHRPRGTLPLGDHKAHPQALAAPLLRKFRTCASEEPDYAGSRERVSSLHGRRLKTGPNRHGPHHAPLSLCQFPQVPHRSDV